MDAGGFDDMLRVDFSMPFHKIVIVLTKLAYRKIEMHDVMHNVRNTTTNEHSWLIERILSGYFLHKATRGTAVFPPLQIYCIEAVHICVIVNLFNKA